jgi:hypothetical protein
MKMDSYLADDIKRLQDGSIDFRHYTAQGHIAKNIELKAISRRVLNSSKGLVRSLPTVATVVLLILVF